MIIQCQECNKDVSSHAIACPHCGAKIGARGPAKEPSRRPNFVAEISWIVILFSFAAIYGGHQEFGVGIAFGVFGLILSRIYKGMMEIDD